jgi:hypothetical protein
MTEFRAEIQAGRTKVWPLREDLNTALERALADALVIGARFIREHDAGAAGGWDARELLSSLKAGVPGYAAKARCLASEREGSPS